jgi:putative ABC transport system permease protein
VLVRLSAREAIWYPHDMGVALAGLILAVATAIGVSLMVDSFRSDFSSMLEQRLSHDLVVEGQPGDLVSLQNALVNEASVSRVQSYRQGELRVAGVPMQIVGTAIDMQEALRYGYMQPLADGEGLISEQAARVLDVGAGERIRVGANTLQVVRVFTSFGDVAPRIVLNLSAPLDGIEMPVVSLSVNSVDPAGLVSRYRQDYPDLDFRLQRDIRILALETFDQTFAITTALVLIALLVASLGIYVAVTAMRLNKKVQMKVLTALGVNRLEMTGMDFALGFGIGLVAMLVAIPLGLALGWILCAVINPRAFGWTVTLQPSFTALMTPVFWGLLAASAAGLVRLGRQERGTSDGHS